MNRISTRLPSVLKKSHLTLAITMACGALTACGSDNNDSTNVVVENKFEQQEKKQDKNDKEVTNKEQNKVDLFDLSHVLTVDINMEDETWNTLRYEGPQVSDWSTACEYEGYDYQKATVTIDGETAKQVDIRKKGWIGSLSTVRPSLKLNYGRGDKFDDRTFNGDKRITLNNNHQDDSDIKQCLAYSIFDDAGLAAPRCNFAKVTVQGQDLDIYTHVEAIKKPFLERAFGDDSGNLYEAQRDGDFTEQRLAYFELKTNKKENDRSGLEQVLSAMQADDDMLISELDKIINLEQFISFIALEALTGHTDGYSGFQNNVYLYRDPADGRFQFIPWGTDQSFKTTHVTAEDESGQRTIEVPASVMLSGELIKRLWDIEDFRLRYDENMRELLATVWDENTLTARADDMAAIVNADEAAVQKVKDFITSRRSMIEAELDGDEREWKWGSKGDVPACPIPTEFSGSFDLTWSTAEQAPVGTFSFTIEGDDTYTVSDFSIATASPGALSNQALNRYNIRMVGVASPKKPPVFVGFQIDPEVWQVGEIPFHGEETQGFAGKLGPTGDFQEFLGMATDGSIILESAEITEGGSVKGSFSGAYVIPLD